MLLFDVICQCECVFYVVVGEVIEECYLMLEDSYFVNMLIDMLMDILLGKLLKMYCEVSMLKVLSLVLECLGIEFNEVVDCVLCLLVVVEKMFLIIIGDCLVIGLVVWD